MANDEGNKQEQWTIEHVETPQFRTVFASGAVFSGPLDGAKHWALTFYSDGAKIVYETLVGTPEQGFRNADPPVIEAQRTRRDEVCVVMTESQLLALVGALGKRLQEQQK